MWTSLSEEHNDYLYDTEINEYSNSCANNNSYVNSKAMKLFYGFKTTPGE